MTLLSGTEGTAAAASFAAATSSSEAVPSLPESNVTDDKLVSGTTTKTTVTTQSPNEAISGSDSEAFEARFGKCIDPIISRLMEGQVRFASVFVDVVGQAAMTFGPDSEEVGAAIEKADAAIGQLLDRLTNKDLWPDKLNLIVTGTPGYAPFPPNHLIDLSTMVDPKLYMAVGESPVLNIRLLGRY